MTPRLARPLLGGNDRQGGRCCVATLQPKSFKICETPQSLLDTFPTPLIRLYPNPSFPFPPCPISLTQPTPIPPLFSSRSSSRNPLYFTFQLIIQIYSLQCLFAQFIAYNSKARPLPTLPMNLLKRSSPCQGKPIIIIDSDSQEVPLTLSHIPPVSNKDFEEFFNPYDAIPEVPNIKLTVQQMNSDPLLLFDQLQTLYSEYGAVKLTACDAWNCPFNFGYADRPATVRKQTMQDLPQGKAFQQRVQAIRIAEYKENAMAFSRRYKFKTNPKGDTLESKRQHEYWNLVTKEQYKNDKVTVQYAADLPSSHYGSGFPTRKVYNWLDADFQYETNLFNLNNLYRAPTSLLRIIGEKEEKISGISLPWMYVGMQFATFCWHVQDLFLNSVNYSHYGETKTWYIIPGHQKEIFDDYVKRNYESSRKKNLLEKITLMIDPLELIKAGIHIFKVHQRPRDYVLTFAKAYHCGFSHGYNVGEAVNFVSCNSVEIIKEAMQYYAEQQIIQRKKMRSHVISYEWIVYQTVNKKLFIPQKFKESIMKEYQLILIKQKGLILNTIAKYGQFPDVRIMLSSKKKYFSNMCNYCKNYVYLTSLECLYCHKNLCEAHLHKCDCTIKPLVKKWVLVIRELNEDRQDLKAIVPMIAVKEVECQQ